jgi:hypothetical protein
MTLRRTGRDNVSRARPRRRTENTPLCPIHTLLTIKDPFITQKIQPFPG